MEFILVCVYLPFTLMNHSCIETLSNGAWGGRWLGLQRGVTLYSGLTPWSYHSAMPGSLCSLSVSHTHSHTWSENIRYAELCDCQKEVREKNFHPANLWVQLDHRNRPMFLQRRKTFFPPKLIYMVNKSQSYGQFNFSIMPSHAKPRLICECCQVVMSSLRKD